MSKLNTKLPLVVIALMFIAGCASTKKVAEEPHVLAGEWAYSLDTPQGVYTGVMKFMEEESGLAGMIAADENPEQFAPLENLMFDSEMSKLTFQFDGGEYGTMKVNTTLTEGKLTGMMNVGAFGVDVSLVASRKAEE
ncbi:MAG: hypothetical protein KTR29_10145 [Rhodothermaceae bacterium]|nr:hypothetical protein [Rhodothermaceae bacterium]